MTVDLPASKSISARALVTDALAANHRQNRATRLLNLSDCDDTRFLSRAFARLSDLTNQSPEQKSDPGFIPEIFVGDGAATFRFFLAAAATLFPYPLIVRGSEQLMSRPVATLLDALNHLGADAQPTERGILLGGKKPLGGEITLDTSVSSQFVSALMMAAPVWPKGLRIRLSGANVSFPYVGMTRGVMESFGATVSLSTEEVEIAPGGYRPPEAYRIESDWSAASYLYELVALGADSEIKMEGLFPPDRSLQGDAQCAHLFSPLGVETRFSHDNSVIIRKKGEAVSQLDRDMSPTPDLVPALAATCCGLGVRFRFRGVGHLRHKESNRLAALAEELKKCGYHLRVGDDSLSWEGERMRADAPLRFSSHGDHRIAMSMMAYGKASGNDWQIDHPEVTSKSFPGFPRLTT